MKTRDIATELDRAFAAATRHALMNGVVISDMVDPLYATHKALNAKHACRELTDEQFTEQASELLWMIGRRRCHVVPTEHEQDAIKIIDRDDVNAQDFGLKSQDRAGPVALNSTPVWRECWHQRVAV